MTLAALAVPSVTSAESIDPRSADAGAEQVVRTSYLDQPFNSYSFWNLPVHGDAWGNGYYQPTNLDTALTYKAASAHNDLLFLDPNAPKKQVQKIESVERAWRQTEEDPVQNRIVNRCEATVGPLDGPALPIPDDFSTLELPDIPSNPDLPTAVINDPGAFDGLSVRETQPLEVCGRGGPVVSAVDYAREFPIDERGDGRSGVPESGGYGYGDFPQGSHGGTGLPAIGGVIRRGEFTSGVIPHALKVSLPIGELYRMGSDNENGFVWPAHRTDDHATNGIGYCGETFGGTNRHLHLGSHLVLPPDFAIGDLSPAGQIIATALRDYGAYVVDSFKPPCEPSPFVPSERSFHVEMGPGRNDGELDVRAEFFEQFGYEFDVYAWKSPTPLSQDLVKIWADIHVLWHPCHDDRNPAGGACAEFIGGGPTNAPASDRLASIINEPGVAPPPPPPPPPPPEDTVAPETEITGPSGQVRAPVGSTIGVTIRATDDIGVASVRVRIRDKARRTWNGGGFVIGETWLVAPRIGGDDRDGTYRIEFVPPTSGRYRVDAEAVDRAGNVDPTRAVRWIKYRSTG